MSARAPPPCAGWWWGEASVFLRSIVLHSQTGPTPGNPTAVTLTPATPLAALLALLLLWALIGLAGLLRPQSLGFVARTLFPLGALVGIAIAVVAAVNLAAPVERVTLLLGLPDLPMHMRLDALASVFLFLLGAASTGISLFAAAYFPRCRGTAPGLLFLHYHPFPPPLRLRPLLTA